VPPASEAALKALGQVIRAERNSRKLSQEKLAELADVHMTYIGKIERGTINVSIDSLVRIAAALELKLATLIHRAQL
jgi:transcriptional regulator with XRE-family HTH domain